MNQIKKKTIYTFNAAGFLLYPVAKAYFSLDDKDVYKMIEDGFSILQKQLSLKGISYNELKGALIPNQDKKGQRCVWLLTQCKLIIQIMEDMYLKN